LGRYFLMQRKEKLLGVCPSVGEKRGRKNPGASSGRKKKKLPKGDKGRKTPS